MKETSHRTHAPGLRTLSLACCLAVPVFAQVAPSSASPEKEEEKETVILSPFTVSSTKDVGYLATSTLAGSRLNTELKDTGAAISVLTPEFLKDIGATNMKDVILFSNNAVPELGDSGSNFNANPMIGNAEWQLRIRGLPASYARNYFTWVTSTDFYNVERIDQSRGPNAILFGFGSAGGIVNTSTKQAKLSELPDEVGFTIGSWNRLRGTVDVNRVLTDKKFAVRFNGVMEDGDSWREYETYSSTRGHLAAIYAFTPTSQLRAEFELGRVRDNLARPWLMIDQAAEWRADGKKTYDGAQWDSTTVTQTWSEHLVYTDNDKTLMNWAYMPFAYSSSKGWAHLAMTDANLAIIPMSASPGGDGAKRETDYHTYTATYENQLSQDLTLEIAYNHQTSDFKGYDPSGGNLTRYSYQGDATELWADASNWLPTGAANPYKGRYYVENNWTRRTQTIKSDQLRATMAWNFTVPSFGKHRLAGMYEHQWRDYERLEEAEVFAGAPFDSSMAEFDSNRLFRRHYFKEGDAADIRVPSWETALSGVKDPVSGKTLSSAWVPNQMIDNNKESQDTILAALQSRFLKDKLVSILGFRHDSMDYSTIPTVRGADGVLKLDGSKREERTFNANTLTAGLVYHVTNNISVYANTSSSRDLPNVNQRIIGYGMPPMPEGKGSDFGMKFDLLGGKLYATAAYYKTDLKQTTEWGDIYASATTRNTRILQALRAAGLITAEEQTARTIDANGYLEDRKADGWEFSLIANPTPAWRISANFSINNVTKSNIMSEVAAWSADTSAWWLQKAAAQGGSGFLLGGGDWDTLGNNIGWMNDYINSMVAFNGRPARGERDYGANLYTRYAFQEGILKGLYVGMGGRWQSANVIGMKGNEVVKGRSLALIDASMGYEFNGKIFGHKTAVDLQLNIANLADTDRYQIYTVAWWDSTASTPERIGLQEPRKITFSATLRF